MKYAILRKTVYPGYFQLIPSWQLQHAEFRPRATQCSKQTLYTFDDAQRMIAYWGEHYPCAEFIVIGDHTTLFQLSINPSEALAN